MYQYFKTKLNRQTIALLFIIFFGLSFRLYGLNWDQNQHLHPDERFLTMVAGSIKWPVSLNQYFDTATSPLNPANAGQTFFVYGTLPLFLTKAIAELLDLGDYNNLTLVGRAISALFDSGTIVVVYLLSRQIWPKSPFFWRIASFFYASSVLPIQLSHFFAVDTILVFFLTLTFYLLGKSSSPSLIGLSFGLALASKISALSFLPIIILLILIKAWLKHRPSLLFHLFIIFLFAYLSFRFFNPYAFASANLFNPKINPLFIKNLKELKSFDNPSAMFPPAVQWINTKPIIFPLRNMFYYGLGIPLGLLAIGGFVYSIYYIVRRSINLISKHRNNLIVYNRQAAAYQLYTQYYRIFILTIIILWVGALFFYQGIQFTKNMRYFLPIYPFLSLIAAHLFTKFLKNPELSKPLISQYLNILISIIIFFHLLFTLSFLSIYSKPHTRVQASEWIYQNIPNGSTLACEHWDDCLPVSLDNNNPSAHNYNMIQLPLYDPDTPEKWQKINNLLDKTDYLIISSNRLYGSIPKAPQRYPLTPQYYSLLFSDQLGFTKVAEFTSYPQFSIFNFQFSINDDSAEESFTVFDHPKVLIFKKVKRVNYGQTL